MRHVRWSDDALDDLEQQIIHIASDNIMAAQQVAKRIRETGNDLSAFATGHPGRVSGTYEKSVNRLPYVTACALDDDDTGLTILRVFTRRATGAPTIGRNDKRHGRHRRRNTASMGAAMLNRQASGHQSKLGDQA